MVTLKLQDKEFEAGCLGKLICMGIIVTNST